MQWLGRSSPGGADRSPLIASFLSDQPNKWRPASSYKLLFLQNAWNGQQCNAKSVSSSYSSGGKKRRSFLKIGRRMKCHWFPPLERILPQEVLASGRMNTNVNSTIARSQRSQLYHCPGHSILNECAQKQLDLSAERVAGVNTNSHAEVVSAGLQ